MNTDLPFIDEHRRSVRASAPATWSAVRDVMARNTARVPHPLVRVLNLDPPDANGPRPLEIGSTTPGFRVTALEAGRGLTFDGRHRFSEYRLDFVVENSGDGCVLTARTYAAFPGLHGAVYRALVIGTRGHVVATRRLLDGIARHAQRM